MKLTTQPTILCMKKLHFMQLYYKRSHDSSLIITSFDIIDAAIV